MSDDEIKAIYDEFVDLIRAQNNIITREQMLKITDISEVKEYIDKMASLYEWTWQVSYVGGDDGIF